MFVPLGSVPCQCQLTPAGGGPSSGVAVKVLKPQPLEDSRITGHGAAGNEFTVTMTATEFPQQLGL
jgi:hypothetical protein